jgi:hypothetical protein
LFPEGCGFDDDSPGVDVPVEDADDPPSLARRRIRIYSRVLATTCRPGCTV